ncbi:MAG TPA: DUF5610 domain-containing protein [Marinobacter sp.]|nr:DUF5610 domain-containing protein [Marinobacter sp.]
MVSPLSGSLYPSPSQSRVTNEASAQRRDAPFPGQVNNAQVNSGQRDSGAKAAESASKTQRQVIRTPEDAINVLRLRLQQKMEQSLGKLEGLGAAAVRNFGGGFQPPSAADVASTVLSFVQLRLEQEAAAGADPERLANLMEQARSGIEKGYGEAREQIEALGLMKPELASQIDDGFNRIQNGLDKLAERFLGQPAAADGGAPVSRSGMQVESASRGAFRFEVTTADGDKVSIVMEESRYSAVQSRSATTGSGESSSLSAISASSGRYSFSVEGDLDSGEREAIAGLLEQAQGVAGQFFRGDVQGAFESARGLNLGGEELASFSLNLSSSRTVSTTAYESTSGQPSLASQLRPLSGLAQNVRELGQGGIDKGLDTPTLNDLVQRMLSDQQPANSDSVNSNRPMMDEFIGAILNGLQAE